jgi:hypothetical protein
MEPVDLIDSSARKKSIGTVSVTLIVTGLSVVRTDTVTDDMVGVAPASGSLA